MAAEHMEGHGKFSLRIAEKPRESFGENVVDTWSATFSTFSVIFKEMMALSVERVFLWVRI